MAMMSLLMMLAPGLLIGAFLDISNPSHAEVVELAVSFLAVAVVFQIVDGAQAVGAGMLRGLQDARILMLYALLGYWGIGLPLGVVLAFYFGLAGMGIWIGLAAGLAAVAILMVVRWVRRHALGLVPWR
jgi:multidrug resistance protein, MATE family